jgi:site-specific recombinase XerD
MSTRSHRNPVYERTPGAFYIRYSDSAHCIRRERVTWKKIREAGIVVKESTKLSQPGRQLAESLLNKRRTVSDAGEKVPALHTRRIAFSEIADDATAYVRSNNCGWKHDATRIAVLKEVFGAMHVEIAPATLRKWLDERQWKPASANRMKTVLSTVYRLAIENGKAKSNPARAIKRRREGNTKLRFLSSQEEIALRAEITHTWPWHLPEYLIALNTGMRPSEQYELEWSNVDFTLRQISVLRSKSDKPRHIPMNSEVVSALRAVEARPLPGKRVFLNEDGRPLVGYKHWFGPALKAAKLCDTGVTWYTLRHGFASRLVMAGVDLRTVADLMGHATIQMTMRYAHLAPEHKLDAVEKLVSTWANTDTNTGTKQDVVIVKPEQVVILQ